MFGFNRTPAETFSAIDMLFGDLPLSYWAGINSTEEPWTLFKEVQKALQENNNEEAIVTLKKITNIPGLESRQYLQAYFFLNQLLQTKVGDLKIFGVVAEVSMPQGCDTLAVYADHSARYYNYSGSAIVWEHGDNSLNELVDEIISQGKILAGQIGPWESPRRAAPAQGMARINFLSSHGLHFGEANQQALFNDPLAGKIMYAMVEVMQALINRTSHGGAKAVV